MDNKPDENGGASWQYKSDDSIAEDAQLHNQLDSASSDSVLVESAVDGQPVMAHDVDEVNKSIEWTASEFIHHDKSFVWYLVLSVVTVIIATLVYLVRHDYFATGAVVVVAIIFGIIGTRKPRSLDYRLDDKGLGVAGKVYSYQHFKSYFVGHDSALASLNLVPLRRFMPILTVYYDPADETDIEETVSNYLPMEQREKDILDKFLQKIRF